MNQKPEAIYISSEINVSKYKLQLKVKVFISIAFGKVLCIDKHSGMVIADISADNYSMLKRIADNFAKHVRIFTGHFLQEV